MEINNTVPAREVGRVDKSRKLLILGVALIILVGIVWFFGSRPRQAVAPEGMGDAKPADLGSSLYAQTGDPTSDKLPETVAPVPNPIEGMYKNPF